MSFCISAALKYLVKVNIYQQQRKYGVTSPDLPGVIVLNGSQDLLGLFPQVGRQLEAVDVAGGVAHHHDGLLGMGEYSSKNSLSCCPGFFENSYFADRQNRHFSKKIAKTLEGGVKCFKNKGKRL